MSKRRRRDFNPLDYATLSGVVTLGAGCVWLTREWFAFANKSCRLLVFVGTDAVADIRRAATDPELAGLVHWLAGNLENLKAFCAFYLE